MFFPLLEMLFTQSLNYLIPTHSSDIGRKQIYIYLEELSFAGHKKLVPSVRFLLYMIFSFNLCTFKFICLKFVLAGRL